jgi:transposase
MADFDVHRRLAADWHDRARRVRGRDQRREMFLAYVEQNLVPTLRQGDVVIMDNLASHNVAGVQEAIERKGARLLYLPA